MDETELNELAKNIGLELTLKTGELFRILIEPERNPQIYSATAYFTTSEDWRTHRIKITASTPRGMHAKRDPDSITCNPKRSPEAIARDICARLLTSARQHLAESIELDKEIRQTQARKKLRLNLIKKYLPHEYQPEKFCNGTRQTTPTIYAQLTYNNLVNLEINLPIGEALALIQHLKRTTRTP